MSGPTPEQWANPAAAPSESDAFLTSEQDILEDALSYAVSTLVLTKARGKHGPDAVRDLAERLQEYARYIGGETKELPRIEAAAPPEPPLAPQKEKSDPKKEPETPKKEAEETPQVETMEWSAFKWLHGNHSVDRAIVTALMKDFKPPATADKSKGDAEMAFCQELCDGGEKRIQDLLVKGDVVGQLAEKIHAASLRLKEGGSRDGSATGQKFSSSGDGVTLSFGKLATFYSGLEAFIGPPKLHIAAAMKYEHCMGKDASRTLIAQNYNTETTSKIEFFFVTAPTAESLEELGISEWPADQRLTRSQKEGADGELNEDTLRGAMPREATHIDEFRPARRLRDDNQAATTLSLSLSLSLSLPSPLTRYSTCATRSCASSTSRRCVTRSSTRRGCTRGQCTSSTTRRCGTRACCTAMLRPRARRILRGDSRICAWATTTSRHSTRSTAR